jgi:subtilisin family serine protease
MRFGIAKLLAVSLLAASLALLGAPMSAHADDDGGSDGGAGGAPGGSDGGSTWRPGFSKQSRRAPRCQCFFALCTCAKPARVSRPRQPPPPPAPAARPRELTVAGLTAAQEEALAAAGYQSLGRRQSGLLSTSITRLRAPDGRSLRRAIAGVREIAPDAVTAENSLYRRNAIRTYRPTGEACGSRCPAFELTAWNSGHGQCAAGATIGVIDTGVDRAHPALAGANLEVLTVRSPDRPPSDLSHGTGVVSLLAGSPSAGVAGLARSARIVAVDAFHGRDERSSADAFDLIAALDVLSAIGAQIVNLSLTGPAHPLLQQAVTASQERGMLLVAAAGVPDPAGRLGYPARYEGVVAVAAVDARMRPSRLSSRGPHISWAAPGVGLTVASAGGRLQAVDGTSFAAPFVSAAFAIGRTRGRTAETTLQTLVDSARDLGAPGRDPVFGWGLVQFGRLPTC